MEKARALALVTILQRDLPGLVRKELAEGVADDGEARGVLSALLRILPSELRAEIEAKAAALTPDLEDGGAVWRRDARSEFPRRAAFARKMLLLLFERGGRPN
jgi:hypothetical protein